MIKKTILALVALPAVFQISAQDARPKYISSSVTEISYTGNSAIGEGLTSRGDIDTLSTRVGYSVMNISKPNYQWSVGGEWNRLAFGTTPGTPVPNTLNSFALTLGNNWKINDRWTLQGNVKPGIYSDLEDLGVGDINAPLSVRAIYAQSQSLQWVIGLSANWRGEIPIVGGIGARWAINDAWTLQAGLPETRLSYTFDDRWKAYVNSRLRGGSYRVGENFGTRIGRPELDDQDFSYREIRSGLGFEAGITKKVRAIVEGGWTWDRRIDYPNTNLQLNGDGAAYFQLAIKASY